MILINDETIRKFLDKTVTFNDYQEKYDNLENNVKSFVYKLRQKDVGLSDYKICLLISFFITLFPIAPSGNIFNNYVCFIYFLPLGFFLYFNYIEKDIFQN